MRVFPVRDPLPGEGLVAIQPALSPTAEAGWRRRLHLHTGRALSDVALATEQQGRSGRLALAGQMLTAGVVRGLEVLLETSSAGGPPRLTIEPGAGLATSGEDVVIAVARSVALGDVPLHGSAQTIGARIAAGAPPAAGVLVLQPVYVEDLAARAEVCERDVASEAFEDQQLVDACRLVFVPWPEDRLPLPARDDRWRNALAWAVFEAEAQRAPGQAAPWEEAGVALALLGFDPAGALLFVDRHAVVRAGGRRRPLATLAPGAGTPLLWHARLEQLAEHLADLEAAGVALASVDQALRWLPPAGLLPVDAVTLATVSSAFLPARWTLEAAPVPAEQVDAALRASAPLARLDMFQGEEVRVLVPVPEAFYDARLLLTEVIDPLFGVRLDQFLTARAGWLARRADVRARTAALTRAISGTARTFPTPDPEALEEETAAEGPLDPAEEPFGTAPRAGAPGILEVTDLAALRTTLDTTTPVTTAELAELDTRGLERFIPFLEDRVNRANDQVDLGFLRVQTDIYRIRQLVLGTTAGTRLATSPALASIAQGASATATRQDIQTFLDAARARPAEPPPAGAVPTPPPGGVRPGGAASPIGATAGLAASRGDTFSSVGSSPVTGVSAAALRIDTGVTGGRPVPGAAAVTTPRAAAIVREETASAGTLFGGGGRPAAPDEIERQAPIVGNATLFRTLSVAERLQSPPAVEAKSFTVASRFEIVDTLTRLDINVDDLAVPGFRVQEGNAVQDRARSVADIRAGGLAGQILQGVHDPDPTDGDEAAFFAAGVRAVDLGTATLRLLEGRVEAYRRAIELCRRTLATLRATLAAADRRLGEIAGELAEARHDVAVTRALLAEEQARVTGINARRQAVLREHVRFLAFVRPRREEARREAPARPLDPGLLESPVPACLEHQGTLPAELSPMLDCFRDAPARWLVALPRLLDRIDRLDGLRAALGGARARAQLLLGARAVMAAPAVTPAAGLGLAIARVVGAQQETLARRRLQTAQLDLGALAGLGWRGTREQAVDVLSLGDLVDGAHGRADVGREAARELDSIARVAACLHAAFGRVEPILRLLWTERLSQHDAPVSLRNLANLPRWGDVEVLERREMQALVDWLYSRVDPYQAEAVGLVSDLVRACVLVASHAPVDRLVAAHVARPTRVVPGGRVELNVDITRARIGMSVLLYSGAQVVARGVLDDLTETTAAARILEAHAAVTLAEGARVHLAEPEGVLGVGFAAGRVR